MRSALIKLSFAAFLLLATVIATRPPPIPKTFSVYIGGLMGASYRLELRNGTLTYTTFAGGFSNPKMTTVSPTASQWREFRKTLDAVNVWQWRAEYPNPGTADGTQWSIDIAYADRALNTHGDNSYPDAAGKPNGEREPPGAFRLYLAAVQKLIGGKTFE